MFKIIDRQLTFNYIKSYVVCLSSLLSLFIVVDLFMNLDNFAENHKGADLFAFIGKYYASKVPLIFDRMSEGIVLMAAMFTIAWMQRNNEILPLLSAGVSTRRIARPVLFAAFLMIGVVAANQEFVLPNIDPFLVEFRGDMKSDRDMDVRPGRDLNEIFFNGQRAVRKGDEMIVRDFVVVFPNDARFQGLPMLQGKEARYRPDRGGWDLYGTTPAQVANLGRKEGVLENPVPGRYFLKTVEIDFKSITRSKNWAQFIPTWQLPEEMNRVDDNKRAMVAVLFQKRITRPLLGILLVFMGLSIILRDQNRNVFISTGLCLILSVVFFLADIASKSMGDNGTLWPIVAAWLPVLIFGPMSFVMFDAVHT